MTPFPYSIDVEAPLAEAHAFLRERRIRHLPVTARRPVLAGILTDRDIKLALGPDLGSPPERELCGPRRVPARLLCRGRRRTLLEDVAVTMAERHVGSALVTRGGKLVGIFTTTDACRALCPHPARAAPGRRTGPGRLRPHERRRRGRSTPAAPTACARRPTCSRRRARTRSGSSAYRKAADHGARTARGPRRDSSIATGCPASRRCPNIGRGIAAALLEMARTGRWTQLERLRGSADPDAAAHRRCRVSGTVSPSASTRSCTSTRSRALELAAHDGRLEIRAGRRAAPGGSDPRQPADDAVAQPPRIARTSAPASVGWAAGRDAARRWTASTASAPRPARCRRSRRAASIPSGEAWLPVLHTVRDGWHFTALYSNTAQAHQLGRTRDWVVIYFYDDEHAEGQHTVVTRDARAAGRPARGAWPRGRVPPALRLRGPLEE
ncbi:MAG: CBS domain-containing protein [Desulfobacterales bacterium]|nr:CBS domain-containing protein [Desulfobacterales bacterium]